MKINKSKKRCIKCKTITEAKTKNFCESVVGKTKCYYVPLKPKPKPKNWSYHNDRRSTN